MAWWMDGGGAVSAGISRSRDASTATRSSSKKEGRFIVEEIGCEGEKSGRTPIGRLAFLGGAVRSRLGLAFGIERLGGELAVGFFQKNFDTAFGFFELLLALAGKRDTFFEKLHGIVERELGAF